MTPNQVPLPAAPPPAPSTSRATQPEPNPELQGLINTVEMLTNEYGRIQKAAEGREYTDLEAARLKALDQQSAVLADRARALGLDIDKHLPK